VCSNTYADKILCLMNYGLCTITSILIITRNGTFIRTFKQVYCNLFECYKQYEEMVTLFLSFHTVGPAHLIGPASLMQHEKVLPFLHTVCNNQIGYNNLLKSSNKCSISSNN